MEKLDVKGGCHDYADAEWIIITGPSRGLNDVPWGVFEH
jgi:hypothetical protein